MYLWEVEYIALLKAGGASKPKCEMVLTKYDTFSDAEERILNEEKENEIVIKAIWRFGEVISK